MVNPAMIRRLEQLEQGAGIGAVRTIWDGGQGAAAIEAAIVGLVAAGKAQPTDRFLTIGWLPAGGPEVPIMAADRPFAP
jgi:hypothetical protein